MTDIEICQYEMLYPIPTLGQDPKGIVLKNKKGWASRGLSGRSNGEPPKLQRT
jgi:hypothetical protein